MTRLFYNQKMRLATAFAISALIIFSGLSIGCQPATPGVTPGTTPVATPGVTPGVTPGTTPGANETPTSSGGSMFNQVPIILSTNLDKDSAATSGTIQLSCVARDPDRRDVLTFTWSATGGTINSTGEGTSESTSSNATWTAPTQVGAYTITVTVSDGRGGQAVKVFSVGVYSTNNYPPYIDKLTADPADPYDDCPSTLTCKATDIEGDEISYMWEASDGVIKGDGPVVTWIPPLVPGAELECTITVRVRDSAGNVSGRKWLHVTSVCACLRPHGSTPETACAPSQEPGYKPPGSASSSGGEGTAPGE